MTWDFLAEWSNGDWVTESEETVIPAITAVVTEPDQIVATVED